MIGGPPGLTPCPTPRLSQPPRRRHVAIRGLLGPPGHPDLPAGRHGHAVDRPIASSASGRTLVRFIDRKSTRLNSSHANISYAVFCLKKTTHLNYSPYVLCLL